MADLVTRLRSQQRVSTYIEWGHEAAGEIESLRSAIVQAQACCEDRARLQSELSRLTAELRHADICMAENRVEAVAEIERLTAENEKLRRTIEHLRFAMRNSPE